MRYAHPGSEGAIVSFKARYGNYIGGEFVPPVKGQYFTNTSPVNGQPIAEFPRSTAEDIDKALDAAHAAADAWGRTSVQERSNILLKIADRIEQNLELLAVTETWDNGKAVRETLNADIPLAADHFRYFAGCIRAQEGSAAEINDSTVAYHIHEPLGVVGQIIPWNFPLLMAAWKLAPALAAGNCVVLKPAEQTPLGICVLLELIGDLLPPGVLNVVQGFGREAGEALATSKRIAKIAFTGSSSSTRRSSPTSTSPSRKAPSCSPAAASRSSKATWPAATTSSRPCSRGTTACACSRRKSSARWSASPPSRTKPRPWPSPTTPSTASAPASGPATSTAPTAWAAGSRPVACGPTATTCTRPTPRSAATRSPASVARRTR
ncbi:aldehyde dehydrogenase [Pseudomonas aeruginosa VRFPA02]|nr:aldehyde dehydrogenase [Pseudomonas aeruginosa VRFPA02]